MPHLIVDFYGFEPKYDRYGVNIDRMLQAVRPFLIDAGWKLVKRYEVNTKDNVKLLVFKLHVNENTASGLYSYAGSVFAGQRKHVSGRGHRYPQQPDLDARD